MKVDFQLRCGGKRDAFLAVAFVCLVGGGFWAARWYFESRLVPPPKARQPSELFAESPFQITNGQSASFHGSLRMPNDLLDATLLYRFRASTPAVAWLSTNLNLAIALKREEVPREFWKRRTGWWKPAVDEPLAFRRTRDPAYGTNAYPWASTDGNFYLLGHNPETGVVYLWHLSNF